MALTSSQIASRLFKQSLTTTETSTLLGYNEEPISSRLSVFPSQIWAQSDQIPSTADPSLKLNASIIGSSYSVGVVKYFRKHTLKTFSGISNKNISFWSEDLIDSIPLNFDPSGASYVFELFKSDGTTPINFGNGDWLVDTNAGVLTFYGTPPTGVDFNNPPKISFYKYIGPKGLGVDSGIGTILGVTAGVGLTGGGTAGYITLDVNVGNGLEVSSDTIYLGGTLSQWTNIELQSNVFTIEQGGTSGQGSGLNQFYFDSGQITLGKNDGFGTSSNINLQDGLTNWSFVVSGSESSIYLSQGVLSTDGTLNTMVVKDTLSKKGLVYAADYTGNFTTHSLVTKGYVDSAVPNVGAGNGLSEITPGIIGLGGTLSQNTLINGQGFSLTIGDLDNIIFTGSVVDVELDNGLFLVDAGDTGSVDLYAGDVLIYGSSSITITSLDEIQISAASASITTSNLTITSLDEIEISTASASITTSNLRGLEYSTDYSGTFVTNSLVSKSYVDSGTSSIWSVINTFSSGLTPSNGLDEFSTGYIGLGGTLSVSTFINADNFDLTIGNIDSLTITASIIDFQLDNGSVFIDSGDNGSVDIYAGDILIYATSSVDIVTNGEFTITTTTGSVTTTNLEGLVYTSDYSGTFVTNSLVTKGYVDSAVPNVGATNGLSEITPGVVGLGGTLSSPTVINGDGFDLTIGNIDTLLFTSSIFDVESDFISLDAGTGSVQIIANSDVSLVSLSGVFGIAADSSLITVSNGEGLVYSTDYTSTFVTHSLVTKGYIDSGTSSIWSVINTFSSGLTPSNGLSEITPGVVGLGGTLSSPTVINGDGFDLTIGNIDTLLFTSSIFDVESDFISLDAGTGSMQLLADGDIDVMSVGEISLGGASGKVTTSNNQGLVYTSDYTSTFVTHSLVTKGYVDSIASSIGADNGITEFLPGTVSLGGSLSQNTLIDVNGNTFSFLDNTGTFSSFFTMATNSLYGKTIEMGLTEDLTNSASSSYISFNVDNGTILQDYNKQVQIATTVPFGTYLFKITAASQSIGDGSTDNHMIIDDYGSKGLVYQDDYELNFTQNSLVTKSFVVNYINTTHFSQDFSVPSNTSGDGASTFQSILYTPFDASSVQVFVNGLLQRLGDGVTASVDCYFSADGGLTPLSIDGVSSGDILYWNGLTSRFDLETDDLISIVYQYKP